MLYLALGKENLKPNWQLSPEAEIVYNTIESNNKEGIKICLEAIWDDLLEQYNYDCDKIPFSKSEMEIFISDMVEIGLIKEI